MDLQKTIRLVPWMGWIRWVGLGGFVGPRDGIGSAVVRVGGLHGHLTLGELVKVSTRFREPWAFWPLPFHGPVAIAPVGASDTAKAGVLAITDGVDRLAVASWFSGRIGLRVLQGGVGLGL